MSREEWTMGGKRLIGFLFVLLLCLFSCALADVPIDDEHFPDPVFRLFVRQQYDRDQDGVLSSAESSAVTSIDCSTTALSRVGSMPQEWLLTGISSVKGIEYFPSLAILNCSTKKRDWPAVEFTDGISNNITVLDLSGNPAIEKVYCYGNQLTGLVLFQNTSLTCLDCHNNALSVLDLSEAPALEEVYCSRNRLTQLITGQNSTLDYLDCSGNMLPALDLSGNPALATLVCGSNDLSELDLSGNPGLLYLYCENNNLSCLDVEKNTGLITLMCGSNRMVKLDHLTECASLTTLSCVDNRLPDLDLSRNKRLSYLFCQRNHLTELDLRNNSALTEVDCSENRLAVLYPGSSSTLKKCCCSRNQLTALDFSQNPGLEELWCQDNLLSDLILTGCPGLRTCVCYQNRLASLDLSRNRDLTMLEVYSNYLVELDVTSVTAFNSFLLGAYRAPKLDRQSTKNLEFCYYADNNNQSIELHVDFYTNVLPCKSGNEPQIAAYRVTVLSDGYGTASASAPMGISQDEIILTTEPDPGYRFKEWRSSPADLAIVNNRFIVRSSDVQVTAVFVPAQENQE